MGHYSSLRVLEDSNGYVLSLYFLIFLIYSSGSIWVLFGPYAFLCLLMGSDWSLKVRMRPDASLWFLKGPYRS